MQSFLTAHEHGQIAVPCYSFGIHRDLGLCSFAPQAASSVSVKRRYRKQRQLLAKLTAENVELRLKLGQREQQHAETVKRLKHEQSVVLRKVQELEGVLEKL